MCAPCVLGQSAGEMGQNGGLRTATHELELDSTEIVPKLTMTENSTQLTILFDSPSQTTVLWVNKHVQAKVAVQVPSLKIRLP